jgi:hypothetical protein
MGYFVHSSLFYFEVEGLNNKKKKDQAFSFASCHDIHIHNALVEHHQIWIYTCLYIKKLKNVDVGFQAMVGYWASTNHL